MIIGYSEFEKNAFVGPISYDVKNGNSNIIIKDNYKGIPITELGGYYGRGVPTPFCVEADIGTPNENSNFGTNYDPDFFSAHNFRVHEYFVNLSLPKTLRSITYTVKSVIGSSYNNEDGEEITDIYVVRCYITIDSSNECFYSSNGKLYSKCTNLLIDDFIY